MASSNDIRATFLDYFARNGHSRGRKLAAGAAQRSHADVHQRRHGAVQERLHRPGEAPLRPRHHGAEMRARRRQAQRPRQCRLHRPPPHLLRNAGQFQLRRLLQGTGHPLRLGAGDQDFGLPKDRLLVTVFSEDDDAAALWQEDRRPAGRAHHPHRHRRQFLAHGRHRPLRPVLRNLLRPRPGHPRRPARQPGRGRRPLHRDLEPRVHAVRGRPARHPRAAAAPVDRHRHGAGALRRDPAGQARQLRHRHVARADPGQRRGHRPGPGRPVQHQPPRHRRPSAQHRLPDRRRRAAVERGPRLRAAPDHAPRHAPRPHDGRARAGDVPPGAGADPPDGRRLSRTGARRDADRRDAAAGGNPLQGDAGARPAPAGRGNRPARRRGSRCPARSRSGCTTPTASRST